MLALCTVPPLFSQTPRASRRPPANLTQTQARNVSKLPVYLEMGLAGAIVRNYSSMAKVALPAGFSIGLFYSLALGSSPLSDAKQAALGASGRLSLCARLLCTPSKFGPRVFVPLLWTAASRVQSALWPAYTVTSTSPLITVEVRHTLD